MRLLLVKENHVTNNALKSEREERPCWNFIVDVKLACQMQIKCEMIQKQKVLVICHTF